MADENNIIIRITGEADLSEANLQLDELKEKEKSLKAQMVELDKQEKQDAASIRATVKDRKQLNAALAENERYYKGLKVDIQNQVNANEKSINSLKKSISTYNMLNGSSNKLMQQLRVMREELMQMEMAGDTSSQAFMDLSVKAAQLQDQMGDTQRQIRILASDTKNLDAAMSIGSGLTGTFTAAQSAMALLGGESEKLQEAFYKVQAATALLNGVQQVANTLNKDSAARVVLRAAKTKIMTALQAKAAAAEAAHTAAIAANTAATNAHAAANVRLSAGFKVATTAARKFFVTLLTNPIFLIAAAVVALGAGIYALTKAFGAQAQAQKAAAKAAESYNRIMASTSAAIEEYNSKRDIEISKIETQTKKDIESAKARGASEIELAQIQLESAKKIRQERSKANADIQGELAWQKNGLEDIIEKNEEVLKTAKVSSKAYNEATKAIQEARKELAQTKTQIQQNDDSLQQAATAIEEQERQLKEMQQKLVRDRAKAIATEQINAMEDGKEKELAQIRASFAEKRAEYIKQYGKNSQLLEALATQQAAAELAVTEKYDKQLLDLKNDTLKTMQGNELMQNEYSFAIREKQLEENEKMEIEAQKKILDEVAKIALSSKDGTISKYDEEREKNALQKIQNIKLKYSEEKKKLELDELNHSIEVANLEIDAQKNANTEKLNNEKLTKKERRKLEQDNANLSLQQVENLQNANETAYENDLILYEEYLKTKNELELQYMEANNQVREANKEVTIQDVQDTLDQISNFANQAFAVAGDFIQNQMDRLTEYYTTDVEEAKKSSNKKYISEKEMNRKMGELKQKQAKLDKATALFNIGLQTALAIMKIWAEVPKADFGATTIAMTAVVSALGIAQAAAVAAKPLPQYAKGRKGGQGELAIVGERGAELMYIPQGASIVPNNKLNNITPKTLAEYGIPTAPRVPEQPNIDQRLMQNVFYDGKNTFYIDYNKIGKAVAENVKIPRQKTVNVNIDKSGVSVSDGHDTHSYLNRKYFGQW